MIRRWLTEGRPRPAIALLVLAAVSVLMILFEGSRPPAQLGLPSFRGLDKLLHFGAHLWVSALLFAGLVLLARPKALRLRLRIVAVVVLLVDGLAGLAAELVQAAVGPGRVFDWKDLSANLAGTSVAIATGMLAARLSRDREGAALQEHRADDRDRRKHSR